MPYNETGFPMAVHTIQSYPDASGHSTLLELDVPDDQAKPLRLSFKHIAAGAAPIDAMTAYLITPFIIRFRKWDLENQRMFWGFFDFSAAGRPSVTPLPAERKILLQYTANAHRVIPARPKDGSVPPTVPDVPPMAFGSITVTLILHAAILTVNRGWINFDFKHTYPNQMPMRDAAFAWEQSIHYPYLDFAGSNPATFEPFITGPMNFSAVYRATKSATALNTATGIAIHVDDVNGHHTSPWYDTEHYSFNSELRNSIHLSGREFVRPAEYLMSGGDAFGFGGNQMVYRIRAFQARGACPGAPVGWYDAMDVYRTWLRTRFGAAGETSLFYDKLRPERAKIAPVDLMAPHTVIANYGLDGAVDPTPRSQEKLCGWLEMHPLRHIAPDTVHAADNASFVQIADRLLAKFPDPDKVKLEIQAWGVEQAGFFQFICGYPPLTNVLTGNSGKFKAGVTALAGNHRTAISITTDPLNTIFNRGRYGGHIRFKGTDWSKVHDHAQWEASIERPFPLKVRGQNCAVTVTKIGPKQFDRVWVVEHFPAIEKVPASPLTAPLKAAQKLNEWGQLSQIPPVIASGLFRAAQKQICPTKDVSQIYLTQWVKPWIIDQNVRLLEFMKHGIQQYFCYRADHQHIVPHAHVPPHTNPAYTNVIGRGSWYTRRLQCLLFDVHELGKVFDRDGFCTFRVIHEFMPREAIAPYIDEYYSGDEKFDFVYSHIVAHHETPGRGGWGIHPGYKEARKVPGSTYLKLEWMLSADRDDETKSPRPPLRTKESTEEELQKRRVSFGLWRKQCVDHFNLHFEVEDWGIAPRAYPTATLRPGDPVPWDPRNPLRPTNPPTYTYNRCVQEWFNLRANLFATGASAVRGVRIMIPSSWLEEPRDYDNEALEHAVRASRMQMAWKDFFRLGFMLGETRILEVDDVDDPKEIWAWGDGGNLTRTFSDVAPLVNHIGADDDVLGNAWSSRPLRDYMSKGWDRESYADGTYNEIVVTPRIHHRIWQLGTGDTRKVLYAFGNVSNTDARVLFLFSRGLQGITNATKWRMTIHSYAPSAINPISAHAWAGKQQTIKIPARSFAAVVVER